MAISPMPVASGSEILTSTSGMGTPMDPAFCLPTGLNVATGEVSVSPYASITVNPRFVMSV